jgi:predicted membrane protein
MKRFIGLVLIAGGILLTLFYLNAFPVQLLIDYLWPSALVLLGMASIIENRRLTIWGLILIGIGALYLLNAAGILSPYELDPQVLIGPVVLVAIGLGLLFGSHHSRVRVHLPKDPININVGGNSKNYNTSSQKHYTAFLGGIEERVADDAFTSCEVTAFLGSAEMDFRDVKFINNEATLTLNAIFGSVECLLPKDVKLIVSGTPFLGGFDNHCVSDATATRTLFVRYSSMFGSIEIKN